MKKRICKNCERYRYFHYVPNPDICILKIEIVNQLDICKYYKKKRLLTSLLMFFELKH